MDIETIGKYKVLGKIGQGSQGVVYKAHDPVLNRFVAIKTISESLGADAEARKRFLREAQSAARLNHPNIVTVFDLGEEQGRVYMAMELLEGKDLRQLVGTPALANLEEKLRIMEEVCDGLAFAHAKDVVHRDIKPANIHLQPNGSVKVMDFGLARLGSSEMTAKGASMGTPNYMSPEQIRGEKTDSRSDVFSMGAVFYEVLTGHKAFDADSLHSVLMKVAESNPSPARRWVPDLPQILVRFLDRAMAKDKAHRFRHAGEMRSALAAVAQVLAGQIQESEGLALLEPSDAEATIIAPGQSPAITLMERGPRSVSISQAPTRATLAGSLPRRRTRPGPGSSPPSRKPGTTGSSPPAPAPAPPASRLPLVLGGVGVLLVAAVGAWYFTRTKTEVPRDISKAQVGALTDALATSHVDLAQENFKDKDFAGAMDQAEQALKLDPQNAEAKLIIDRARSTLKELDGAAEEARSAVQSGNVEAASKALSRVLAINPNHPVANELSAQLNQHFRSQAEEARQAMAAARAAAEKAKAGTQKAFGEATEAAKTAERSFASKEYAVATRRYLESRDAFDRAVRAAEAPPKPAPVPQPPTAPSAQASASAAPAPQPSASVASPSTPSTFALASAPPSAPVPAYSPSLRPPAAPAPAGGAPGDDAAIRRVVEEYGRAIQAKDLALFRAVKPNLSADEEKRLRAIFKMYKSYKVSISVVSIQLEGAEAKVRVSRQDTVDGNPFVVQQALTLVKGPEGWTIRDIGQ